TTLFRSKRLSNLCKRNTTGRRAMSIICSGCVVRGARSDQQRSFHRPSKVYLYAVPVLLSRYATSCKTRDPPLYEGQPFLCMILWRWHRLTFRVSDTINDLETGIRRVLP